MQNFYNLLSSNNYQMFRTQLKQLTSKILPILNLIHQCNNYFKNQELHLFEVLFPLLFYYKQQVDKNKLLQLFQPILKLLTFISSKQENVVEYNLDHLKNILYPELFNYLGSYMKNLKHQMRLLQRQFPLISMNCIWVCIWENTYDIIVKQ